MKDQIHKILQTFPDTRNGTQPLLAKWAELNGAPKEVIDWLYKTPIENIARIRRELIQEDKDNGTNKIQPANQKMLQEKEFKFYHHFNPFRKSQDILKF